MEIFEDQEVKPGEPTLQEDAGREEDDDMSLAAVISEALHQFRAQDREEAIVEESHQHEDDNTQDSNTITEDDDLSSVDDLSNIGAIMMMIQIFCWKSSLTCLY